MFPWRKAIIAFALLFMLVGCDRSTSEGLSDKEQVYLQEMGLLSTDETVLFFDYATSPKQDGNFFTDQRVAAYWIDDYGRESETTKESARYDEITDISMTYAADWSYAHDITITRSDGSSFHVYVSSNKDYADEFLAAMKARWHSHHQLEDASQ